MTDISNNRINENSMSDISDNPIVVPMDGPMGGPMGGPMDGPRGGPMDGPRGGPRSVSMPMAQSSHMGGGIGLLIAMVNNPIYADIKDNKIIKLYNINENLKISDAIMKKMQNNLDTDGFLKLNINVNNLFNIYNEILKNNDVLNDRYKIDINQISITSGKIILDFCSTLGLFILTKESDENFNKNIITILTPKSLFTDRYSEHINITFDGIIIPKIMSLIPGKNEQDVLIGRINMVREFLLKFFQQFNKSSNNNEIKFANLMNFLVNLLVVFFVIIMLTSLGLPMGNIFAEAINMFSVLLSKFPNDACYFDNNILMFEPNICENKNKTIVKNEKKASNYTLVLGGSVCVTILIIILLLLKINMTKKNKKN
jgi:hypothetical protein